MKDYRINIKDLKSKAIKVVLAMTLACFAVTPVALASNEEATPQDSPQQDQAVPISDEEPDALEVAEPSSEAIVESEPAQEPEVLPAEPIEQHTFSVGLSPEGLTQTDTPLTLELLRQVSSDVFDKVEDIYVIPGGEPHEIINLDSGIYKIDFPDGFYINADGSKTTVSPKTLMTFSGTSEEIGESLLIPYDSSLNLFVTILTDTTPIEITSVSADISHKEELNKNKSDANQKESLDSSDINEVELKDIEQIEAAALTKIDVLLDGAGISAEDPKLTVTLQVFQNDEWSDFSTITFSPDDLCHAIEIPSGTYRFALGDDGYKHADGSISVLADTVSVQHGKTELEYSSEEGFSVKTGTTKRITLSLELGSDSIMNRAIEAVEKNDVFMLTSFRAPARVAVPMLGVYAGTCNLYIGATWKGGNTSYFDVSDFTGVLSGGWAVGAFECLDYTAADPSYQWAAYAEAYVNDYSVSGGWIQYYVYVYPYGVTDGYSNNGYGLIGYQRIGGYVRVAHDFGGSVRLNKVADCPDLLGLSSYSLAGAKYGLYKDAGCTSLLETLTTNANGQAVSAHRDPGTYYIKELAAPEGFILSDRVYSVSISGGDKTISVIEKSINDPADALVHKYDIETGGTALGDATLGGAQFTVKFYDGYFDVNPETLGISPVRTWIYETDIDGYVNLYDKPISGDRQYLLAANTPILPMGTVTIQETKAPEGYLLPEDAPVFVQKITREGIEGEAPDVWNIKEQPEQVIRGGIAVQKSVIGAETSVEGIKFKVVDSSDSYVTWKDASGKIVDMLELNASGYASTPDDAFPYGTYRLEEVAESVSADIMAYRDALGQGSDIAVEVVVTDDHQIVEVPVVNYAKPTLTLVKIDADSLRDSGEEKSASPVEGAVWALEYDQGGTWVVIESAVTDVAGQISFSESALSRFGTYRLVETRAANEDKDDGYMPRKDSGLSEECTFIVNGDTFVKAEAGTYEGTPGESWSFSVVDGRSNITHTDQNWRYRFIEAQKVDQDSNEPVSDTLFYLYKYTGDDVPSEVISLNREEIHEAFEVRPESTIDESRWVRVAEGMTDKSGSHLFKKLPFGYYLLEEKAPNPAYAEWWESAASTWNTYYFSVEKEDPQHQIQIFKNEKITLECNLTKKTIARTSAAFNSLPDQNVSFRNVNKEEYRYDVSFDNGNTNFSTDQYSVIDNCEFTNMGLRMTRMWTPIVANDSDGLYNIWYKTNMTSDGKVYSTESATASNSYNPLSDGTDRISTVGYKLWKANQDVASREQLPVADLGLAPDEHITSVLLEFGSVAPNFTTTTELSYMVICTQEMINEKDQDIYVIPASANSFITRNWSSGQKAQLMTKSGGAPVGEFASDTQSGLVYNDSDAVETRVIDTFAYGPSSMSRPVPSGTLAALPTDSQGMPQTGDNLAHLAPLLVAIALLAGTTTVVFYRKNKKQVKGVR